MSPYIKGFAGAVIGTFLALFLFTAYQDHKVLWEVVRALQPKPGGQSEAPK